LSAAIPKGEALSTYRQNVAKAVAGLLLFSAVLDAWAQSSANLAPGFSSRPKESRLVIVPVDVELFSISGGGVSEPKADWTQAAVGHIDAALAARKGFFGASVPRLQDKDMDDLAELNALHAAVARSVFLHHSPGMLKLPTKNNMMDWSMGDSVKALKDKTGADYALFIWIRDSYATAERKAAMVMMALLRVGVVGGAQTGYASLVDLNNGRVVWFNNLLRATGDLRDAASATETLDTLLKGFPVSK
jgi:hypothetical protein